VLSHNIQAAADGGSLQEYDGYTVMPITTERHKLMLVEVDRDGNRKPSVPFPDLVVPRRATWAMDRYGLPVTYFKRILRGKV
jgi:sulfide:quinone oxidoreductase